MILPRAFRCNVGFKMRKSIYLFVTEPLNFTYTFITFNPRNFRSLLKKSAENGGQSGHLLVSIMVGIVDPKIIVSRASYIDLR